MKREKERERERDSGKRKHGERERERSVKEKRNGKFLFGNSNRNRILKGIGPVKEIQMIKEWETVNLIVFSLKVVIDMFFSRNKQFFTYGNLFYLDGAWQKDH
jgi:hypothetical protein